MQRSTRRGLRGVVLSSAVLGLSLWVQRVSTFRPSSRRASCIAPCRDSRTIANTRLESGRNLVNRRLLLQNNDSEEADKNDTSALYSSNILSSHDETVRWEDLLRSIQPISCEEGDEPCIIRRESPVEPVENERITVFDVASISTFITALSAGLVWLIILSGPGAWRYYLSGGICAAASHVVPVPIDVVKTRKQVDPRMANMTFLQAFRYILKNEGPKGLLSGLGPTAVGYLLEGSIKFGVYEVMKPAVTALLLNLAALSGYLAFLRSRVLAFLISAAVSGVAASVLLCPMEALRIRMVANPKLASKGWMVTGYKILKKEGALALGRGFMPMLSKQVPYTMTKNVSFDFITRYGYAALAGRGSVIGPVAKVAVPFTAAALTSVLSCITSQPGDMVLSLIYANSGDTRRTRDVVRDIVMSERGFKGFFVGTKTRFLHVGIIVTMQLLIYDVVKRLCGIAATGMS